MVDPGEACDDNNNANDGTNTNDDTNHETETSPATAVRILQEEDQFPNGEEPTDKDGSDDETQLDDAGGKTQAEPVHSNPQIESPDSVWNQQTQVLPYSN